MNGIRLGDTIFLSLNNRPGTVIGIAEYSFKPRSYYIEYINGVGDVAKDWFEQMELIVA